MSTKNNAQPVDTKFRESTWQERMSQLPKNSAYKSSITFHEEGVTIREEKQTNN
jgi:hypothetical protein